MPATSHQPVPTLLVIRDERLRDGVQVMLSAAAGTLSTELASEPHVVTDWLERHPDCLVIFDFEAFKAAERVLAQRKTRLPKVCCIVIAGSLNQLRSARRAGADAALLSGFSSCELLGAIQSVVDKELSER